MTSGQYSFCLLLNADWLIQISEGLAVCKDGFDGLYLARRIFGGLGGYGKAYFSGVG